MPGWAFGELKNYGIRICKDCGEATLEDDMHWCPKKEAIMEPDPITQIQQEKDFEDIGRSGYLMLKGAMAEGASFREAMAVVSAWFQGMFASASGTEEDEEASSS